MWFHNLYCDLLEPDEKKKSNKIDTKQQKIA